MRLIKLVPVRFDHLPTLYSQILKHCLCVTVCSIKKLEIKLADVKALLALTALAVILPDSTRSTPPQGKTI